jgi:hypothetical protein
MNEPDECPMCSRPVCCFLELCDCDDPVCTATCHTIYHQETP